MASRFGHSTTNFMISDNLFWIIVRGGYRQFNTMNNATQFVTGADTTVIVELGMILFLYFIFQLEYKQRIIVMIVCVCVCDDRSY